MFRFAKIPHILAMRHSSQCVAGHVIAGLRSVRTAESSEAKLSLLQVGFKRSVSRIKKIIFIFSLFFSASASAYTAGTYTLGFSTEVANVGDPATVCNNLTVLTKMRAVYSTTITNISFIGDGSTFVCTADMSIFGGANSWFSSLGATHKYSSVVYVDLAAQAAADAAAAAAQAAANLAASQAAASAAAAVASGTTGTTGTAPAYAASPELVTAINSVTSAISTSGSATNGALALTNTNLSALNGSLLGINTSLQSVASALVPSTDSAGATSAFTSGLEMGSKIVGLMLLAWGFVVIRKVL